MAEAGNRRGFLRETFLGAARTTVDAATTVHSARTEIKKAVLPGVFDRPKPADGDNAPAHTEWSAPAAAPTRPAAATSRVASHDDLITLAQEIGIGTRSQELREMAQHSIRLTVDEHSGAPGGRTRIGGQPDLPPDREWPTRQGNRLAFLAQLDLTAFGSIEVDFALPPTGLLLIFYDVAHRTGTDQVDAEAARVLYVADNDVPIAADVGEIEPFVEARPIRLSGELVLPRPWSARVHSLSLQGSETKAWSELRELLARDQGVQLTEGSGHALHRMFGYPDNTRGDMPLACELVSLGLSCVGVPPNANPDAALAELTADRWRLLFQLSSDDDLGCSWGTGHERLYFWIADDDLRAGDFSRVLGILP